MELKGTTKKVLYLFLILLVLSGWVWSSMQGGYLGIRLSVHSVSSTALTLRLDRKDEIYNDIDYYIAAYPGIILERKISRGRWETIEPKDNAFNTDNDVLPAESTHEWTVDFEESYGITLKPGVYRVGREVVQMCYWHSLHYPIQTYYAEFVIIDWGQVALITVALAGVIASVIYIREKKKLKVYNEDKK